jgi:putative transposase
MAKGFLYLVVIMEWASRAVLAWRLSNTLDADFCVEVLEEALSRYGRPEIFITDQGSQFTSDDFTGTPKRHGVTINMDGKGRCTDNIFVERLWRSRSQDRHWLLAALLQHGAPAPESGLSHTMANLLATPVDMWTIALPTGCASRASQASSEGGEILTFAHIPTGTTANKAVHIDASKTRGIASAAAPRMIGAEIETGAATP